MKKIAELAKAMSANNKNEAVDFGEMNEHVSAVLDEHLDMISAAHQSTHDSNHYSSPGNDGMP
ncbi:hypothetical protein [Pseudoalteromonas sp. MMG012]|uniref:hypothetical protein n=1 Tax=Pseudoalteromonas sp. MMG012 TaxID=2822686 RepID=UPI001B39E6C8|nr:hypothetical protein [Pseudoalteromonas sp. MMG012]MBQ4851217.1 hypothetical protein [Pseudoalteromonas sp. MMG012]